MPERSRKDALYEQLARIGKALSAPRRLELVDLLGQAPRTVDALAQETGMSIANTSQHLQVLRAAGLVESEKSGVFVSYRLASADVVELFLGLRGLAETRLAEMDRVKQQFFPVDGDVDEATDKELLALVRRGRAVLVDVRPVDEYEAGHLSGAISIPHDVLKERLGELPKDRKIVAYCRGPYCVFAAQAVKLLRARGFDATRIEEGVPEWRARGLPVEKGAAA